MKKIIPLILITLSSICGCQKKDNSSTSSYVEPHYNEVEELHIEWKDLFNQSENQFYAYVYSVTCTPCSMLRTEITEFAKSGKVKLYFIFPSDDIAFTNDETLADASLGATSLENVYCYSTPTLIEITANAVTKYTRDYYEIKSFIASFG